MINEKKIITIKIELKNRFYKMFSLISNLFSMENLRIRVKTLIFLCLFICLSPLICLITMITLIIHLFQREEIPLNKNSKKILVSGGGMTKSLQLARSLHSSGHRVYLTEEYSYTSHRFSRSVERFCLCRNTKSNQSYIESIIEIVKREQIDLFIPVSHSWCECDDSIVKNSLLSLNCQTIQGDFDQLEMLSDKYRFISRAKSLGLSVPKTFRITNRKEIFDFDFSKETSSFILKSLIDNNLTRWNLMKFPCSTREEMIDYVNQLDISEDNPWILQEFIEGKEYCTHGTVRNGELRLYSCCPSSSWLLRYKHIDDKPLILDWVREFCLKENLTGQTSFDFIESKQNGRPYVLECNPRTHTAITTFYNHRRVAEAYLDSTPLLSGPIQPHRTTRQVYWFHHELWNCLQIRSFKDFTQQIQLFIEGKEAIYSIDDPLPFLFHYTIHMPIVLIQNLLNPIPFTKVDCNLALLL